MLTPPKAPRRRTLKTQLDCRRALAWIFGELEGERLDVGRARVMVYTLQNLSAILDRSELEAELEAIRRTLEAAGHEVKR
jgi:hypothetical protein